MRNGFTTGSCAAAAAKAASYMLFTKTKKEKISIITPKGIVYEPDVECIDIGLDYVACGIKKDGGDDPDITNGIYICAKVKESESQEQVKILGGVGVGRVTRPGLEMPVGQWAINSTPRRMIEKEVKEVIDLFDFKGSLEVEIYVPEGEEVAKKTFNPHMGIVDGISILGTTGIVEPMSSKALIKTIELDLSQKKAEGSDVAIMVPGNYGATFLKENYGIDEEKIVHFSNYVGVAIDKAKEVGFSKILIVGHTGKLVKVSGGIMNTHSKEADARLELMTAAVLEAAKEYAFIVEADFLSELLSQVTTTAALELLENRGILKPTCQVLLKKILFHLRKRAGDDIEVECILYENNFGLLAKSEGAEELL